VRTHLMQAMFLNIVFAFSFMVSAFASQFALALAPANEIENDQESSQVELLNRMSYTTVLPQLRTMLGRDGQEKIAAMNTVYRQLKAEGNQMPTFGNVFSRYQKEKMESADVGSGINAVCTLLILAPAVGMAVRATIEVVKTKVGQSRSECRNKISQVIEDTKAISQQTASLAGAVK
jgi:hypothetical protein